MVFSGGNDGDVVGEKPDLGWWGFGRSVSIILKRVGLRTAPRGTSFSIGMNWEVWLLPLTQSDLLEPGEYGTGYAKSGSFVDEPWVHTES